MSIGILIIATHKYFQFAKALIPTVIKHFLPGYARTVYLFTDQPSDYVLPAYFVYTKHEPWPAMTLNRYAIFDNAYDLLSQEDYLFYMDADSLICADVGVEVLPETSQQLVAVRHPGFFNGGGSWETNTHSTAYVRPSERKKYFAGGFQGGQAKTFLSASAYMKGEIHFDTAMKVTAVHNDESHWNRYLIGKPTHELTPEYTWPQNCDWFKPKPEWTPKIIALSKNHEDVRS